MHGSWGRYGQRHQASNAPREVYTAPREASYAPREANNAFREASNAPRPTSSGPATRSQGWWQSPANPGLTPKRPEASSAAPAKRPLPSRPMFATDRYSQDGNLSEQASAAAPVKRPLPSREEPKAAFRVVSKTVAKEEIGIDTLVGDYNECGSNHGRRYYKKIQKIPGHEDIKVFLYWWDERDGADFSGWWFGNELGGSQVWARSTQNLPHPPRVGWRIPWDAHKSVPGLLVCEPVDNSEESRWADGGFQSENAASNARIPTPSVRGGLIPSNSTSALEARRKAQKEQEIAEAEAARIANEEKAEADLKKHLEGGTELVVAAEDFLAVVEQMAEPLLLDPPEEPSDVIRKAVLDVESNAKQAQDKVSQARRDLNARLTPWKGNASNEVRNTAITEFGKLQARMTELQKKLGPLKNFKREFAQKIETRKSIKTIITKLEAAEIEVEKATLMLSGPEKLMTEEEVKAVQKVLHPAQHSITAASRMVETSMASMDQADSPKKEGVLKLMKRVSDSAEAIVFALKKNKEGITASEGVAHLAKKIDKADEAWIVCQEAEMPFLKGIEILPLDESENAVEESEAAASKCENMIAQAKAALRARMAESKKFHKDVAAQVTDDLKTQETRLENVSSKLGLFRKETAERKVASMLAEVHECTSKAERAVEALGAAVIEVSAEKFELVETEVLKEAVEKASAAEKVANVAIGKARKVLSIKQRESKELKEGDADAALAKLGGRLTSAQSDLSKHRSISSSSDRLLKGREVYIEQLAKAKDIEVEIEKSEKPAESGGKNSSDEQIETMSSCLTGALKIAKTSAKMLEQHLVGAPTPLKIPMEKLLVRFKSGQEKLNSLLSSTRERRESVMSESMIKEGKAKADALDAALAKVEEAELPFLKGVEVLPLAETQDMVKESEAAILETDTLLCNLRTFAATKKVEIRGYADEMSKPVIAEFVLLTERSNASASKLSVFKKDTASRKFGCQMQEVEVEVAKAEEEVKQIEQAIAPFMAENAEEMPEEEVSKHCEILIELLKKCQEIHDGARNSIASLRKDGKNKAPQINSLDKLQARLKTAQVTLAKHKKNASNHEAKYVSKKLIASITEQVVSTETLKEKCESTASCLLNDGGLKFLICNSVDTLSVALYDWMKVKQLTIDGLYKQIVTECGGAVKEGPFVSYLEKLPEATGHEEITFTPKRRQEIFKHIDKDSTGSISGDGFKQIFAMRYICVKAVSVTENFDLRESKAVVKIEPGEILEAVGAPQVVEGGGMTRLECKVVATGKVGWVTLAGNQGSRYAELLTAFKVYIDELDEILNETTRSVNKVSQLLTIKFKELASTGPGPLSDARKEIERMRPRVSSVHSTVDAIRRRLVAAKQDFKKKEIEEKTAYIEARIKREADEITKVSAEKVNEVEIAVAKIVEETQPITSLNDEDLFSFGSPLATSSTAADASAIANDLGKIAKEIIQDQFAKLPQESEMSNVHVRARKDLQRLNAKVESCKKQVATVIADVRNACTKIAEETQKKVRVLLRKSMTEGVSIDDVFNVMVKSGEDRIRSESFIKYISGRDGQCFISDHLVLLFRHLEADGINQQRFKRFLQQYFIVVKQISLTTGFEISKGKQLRKANVDEVFEVLEGPIADEKVKVSRIRVRSLLDNTIGWVTLKGNQGTPFLEETTKKFWSCSQVAGLRSEFKGGSEIRQTNADEVFELLEGPRKEEVISPKRLKVKVVKDEAVTGWMSASDRRGEIFAQMDDRKYKCTMTIAMTDSTEIKTSKVLRKLAVGEVLEAEDDPVEEDGIIRVRGKAEKDGLVGWITIKGSAGTIYAQASTKHWKIIKSTTVQGRFPSSSEDLCSVDVGDSIEVMEGPREEVILTTDSVRVRSLTDGAEGWISLAKDHFQPWSPYFKCKVAVPLQDTKELKGAASIRQIEVGEKLDLISGPVVDGGSLRIFAKASKDGVVGWTTVRSENGNVLLEC